MLLIGAVLLTVGSVLTAAAVLDLTSLPVAVPGMILLVAGLLVVLAAGLRRLLITRLLRLVPEPLRPKAPEKPTDGLIPSGSPFKRAKALPRLLRASRTGVYAGLGGRTKWLWVLSLVYLVSPIDTIPDLFPAVGVSDDGGLLVWLAGSVLAETGRFLTWERTTPAAGVPAARTD